MASATFTKPALAPQRSWRLLVAAVLDTGVVLSSIMRCDGRPLSAFLRSTARGVLPFPAPMSPRRRPRWRLLYPAQNKVRPPRRRDGHQSWLAYCPPSATALRHWQSVRARRQRPVRSASRMAGRYPPVRPGCWPVIGLPNHGRSHDATVTAGFNFTDAPASGEATSSTTVPLEPTR